MTLPHEDDTVLDAIAAQARAFAPLPLEEIAVLLKDAAGHPDGPAKERLIEHHLFIALEAALAHRGRGLDIGDLYQEGTLAVMAAVGEYGTRGGTAAGLKPFVEKVAAAHMETAIAADQAARKSDVALVEAAERLDVIEARLRQELGREVTPAELAVELGWPESQVSMVRTMLAAAREMWDEDIAQYLDDDDAAEPG